MDRVDVMGADDSTQPGAVFRGWIDDDESVDEWSVVLMPRGSKLPELEPEEPSPRC